MHNNIFSITVEPADPALLRQRELFHQNAEWLSQHWQLVGDECRGKMVAASGGEIFVADDPQEVERMAKAKHPDDVPFTIYIPKEKRARIYGNRSLSHMPRQETLNAR